MLGAVAQHEFRRILSFHIISQIGYMMMGLGLFTPFALAASIFYVLHHIIVKTNLFFISGIVHRIRGTYELRRLGGLQTLIRSWRCCSYPGHVARGDSSAVRILRQARSDPRRDRRG